MIGGDPSSALAYHQATKHSEVSMRMSGHYLDWSNKPSPFKFYKNLQLTALPHDFHHPTEDSVKAVAAKSFGEIKQSLDLQALAEILFFSAGLTRRLRFGKETVYMRAASATGALYPIELYVISPGTAGLDSGVYHFNPMDFALAQVRRGDYSSELAFATSGFTVNSVLTLVFTSIAWRNAWKYEARSYRHWFWDAGVIAANLLATGFSERIPVRLALGFNDEEIDRLLGVKSSEEASVALATIGTQRDQYLPEEKGSLLEISPAVDESTQEVSYPIIWQMNEASTLKNGEVEKWRESLKSAPRRAASPDRVFPLQLSRFKSGSLADTILRRGSTRRFAQQPISFEALSSIIDASTYLIPLDFLEDDQTLIEFYLIANDVQGLPSGCYYFDREARVLEQLKQGKMRYASGYLCLEQPLFSDASVVFFLMTDLNQALADLGARGYRAAQFEAGVRAGKIYLSSYALGIGASGSTFYDDTVTEFFSPHATKMSTMIAVGVGVPAYKAKPGRILPQFGSKPS